MNLTSSNASNFGKHVKKGKETTMNLTSNNGSIGISTWKNLKTKYVVAAAGIALAASVAIGGAGVLKLNSTPSNLGATSWLPTHALSVQPQFGTAVDAEQAAQGLIAVQPQFGTEADAEHASRGLQADIMASVMSTELANFRSIESTPSVSQVAAERPALTTLQEQVLVGLMPDSHHQVSDANTASQVAAERAALTTLQEQVLVGLMPDGQRQTSDADIMASVVSTERAAYGNPERTQPLFANAADAEQAGNVAALESPFSVTLQGSFENIEDYAARERAALATLSNDTSARAADADIMASVISTERAAYGNLEPVQPMFGTAADAEYAAQSLR